MQWAWHMMLTTSEDIIHHNEQGLTARVVDVVANIWLSRITGCRLYQ